MKANIRLALNGLKPSDLLTFFRNVEAKMTEHAGDFPSPPVAMGEMVTLAQQLEDAIEAAIRGSAQSRLVREERVAEAREVLQRQANYVRLVADGNAAHLERSGFPLTRPRTPVGIPGVPLNMEARMTGLAGQVELRWKSVHGARGYQVWMTDQDPAVSANWQAIGYTTRVKHLVTDLESFKAYFFCVSAIGTAGEGAQSDPALGRAA
ncbi:MAG: fibronectin type III domain-containing protein [Flavobacteriales bacterium]|nr:fibronectin type III domain-containing protein [Flavobacteriales bacterium]